jgi:hypothetical protein
MPSKPRIAAADDKEIEAYKKCRQGNLPVTIILSLDQFYSFYNFEEIVNKLHRNERNNDN